MASWSVFPVLRPNWMPTLKVDTEGYATIQMHEFMHTFGKSLYPGALPFASMEVLVEID